MSDLVELSGIGRLRRANKAEAAEFFDISMTAFDGWIRRGCPVVSRGDRKNPWVFDLLAVAEWRFKGTSQESEVDPDRMTPIDRKAWYDGETKKVALMEKARELIPASEVGKVVSTAFSAIAQSARAIPDNLERRMSLPPEVVGEVVAAIDHGLEDLADRLSKLAPVSGSKRVSARAT